MDSQPFTQLCGQEALEHLASIDLIELCNEAKVERCRATRDLRSCGRVVQYVLNSCGHASLCAECSQRCDLCPICRIPIPKNGTRLRLRLYYECIEAGLISKRYDDRFQDEEDGEKQLAADVQRLHSLFDISLENNLVSLICHYVTDVCMDKSAVSSDPVIAFLLDEVVVKDWCLRAFSKIIADLCRIYALEVGEIERTLSLLQRFSMQLTGISNVLEVLESSIKGMLSAPYDLHCLQENVLKAKQHLEIMIWCTRHRFLQNVISRHPDHLSWCSLFRERKSAAVKRSWPDLILTSSSKSVKHNGSTLFIEDALSNLEMEKGHEQEIEKDIEITALAEDGGTSLFFKSKVDGVIGCYPFESLRAATDILFLCGSADMVVAKQAIFLYYLFDRHWTIPDERWRYLVEDFASSFGITRHSVLESFTFYLLDDHTDQALQEACSFLPEIAGPERHPKIAQVLLERQNPDAALMVLRWCGYDGLCSNENVGHGHSRSQLVSLPVAVTAVRVRVECGLLTEAFMYQRSHCLKVKEEKLKHGSSRVFSANIKGENETWLDWQEALVTEICCLCFRRNLVDRMIELPWNSDEEKYLHKCLLDCAVEDPSATSGSLLVVYYLQRFRYIEAYQVDRELQKLENDFMSQRFSDDNVISKIRSINRWRTGLVDKCIELLPKVQQNQLKTGTFDIGFPPGKEMGTLSKSDLTEVQAPNSTSSLAPLLPSSKKISSFESQPNLGGFILNKGFLRPVRGTSPDKEKLISKEPGIRDNFQVDEDAPIIRFHHVSPQSSTPLNKTKNFHLPYPSRIDNEAMITPASNDRGFMKDSIRELNPAISGTKKSSYNPRAVTTTDNVMDTSWSFRNGDSTVEDTSMNNELRWRCDEASDNEDDPSPEKIFSGASSVTPLRRTRRSRFSSGL